MWVVLTLVIGVSLGPEAFGEIDDYRQNRIQAPKKVWLQDSVEYDQIQPRSSADLPLECLSLVGGLPKACSGDRELDLAIEQEYWSCIAYRDTFCMKNWLRRTELYLFHYRDNPNEGRIRMLQIFGQLHAYSEKAITFDWLQSPRVLQALVKAEQAQKLLPRSPNVSAFYWAIRNFGYFAFGWNRLGMSAANEMLALEESFGKEGLAGPIGAVAHMLGSADKAIVRQGVDLFDDCLEQGVCRWSTSIAPFQVLGTRLTQAEAIAYLGDDEATERYLSAAEKLAIEKRWPFLGEVAKVREEIFRKGGLQDQWQAKNQRGIRAPLGSAHKVDACSWCHVGNQVPEHYYLPHSE